MEQELSLLPVGGGAFRVPSPDVQATWAPQLRKGPEPDRPGLREDTARAQGQTSSGSGVTGGPGHRPGTQKVSLSPSSQTPPSSTPDRGESLGGDAARMTCRQLALGVCFGTGSVLSALHSSHAIQRPGQGPSH